MALQFQAVLKCDKPGCVTKYPVEITLKEGMQGIPLFEFDMPKGWFHHRARNSQDEDELLCPEHS